MAMVSAFVLAAAVAGSPPGRLVDVGGHRVHLHCLGRGRPTVVIENGFDEVSTDWARVQDRVARTTRICTYDRAGYAWSDPGPLPRSFAQIASELRTALDRAGEKPPFVLAGHSFGGGPVREYALAYPREVAGLLLVEAVSENQRILMGDRAGYIADFAQGRAIPPPRATMTAADHAGSANESPTDIAAASEREWSSETMAVWRKTPQAGSLGGLPLVVLTRARGGYEDGPGYTAREIEEERLAAQRGLAFLSTAGRHVLVDSGHDMQTEAPDAVSAAIESVVATVRKPRQ
jgi:pimeloyl-ACP methyl ester carboxylesterase